jgi:hypothetical protein
LTDLSAAATSVATGRDVEHISQNLFSVHAQDIARLKIPHEPEDDIKGYDKKKDLEDQEQDTINELDDLVTIKGKKLKSLQESSKSPQVELIHSLKESTMNKVIKKSPTHLLQYCNDKLIRVYPDNLRVDSSNYDPMPAWNYGSQLVALNYQTSDQPMWVNRGRFRDNGNCGYLLRPPFHQPEGELRAAASHKRDLTGSQLRRLQKQERRYEIE